MEETRYQLAPLVGFDDYDTSGFLLDIRHNHLIELNERDTCILSAILPSLTLAEVLQHLETHSPFVGTISEGEVLALREKFKDQKLIERRSMSSPCDSSHEPANTHKHEEKEQPGYPYFVTRRQRLVGAGHIIAVVAELCTGEDGVYHAYQYIGKLKKCCVTKNISDAFIIALVNKEYWFYRLITGLIERRTARVIGQMPGNEGLCLIRSLALCAYLLSLDVPATIIVARPKYGSRSGFKLHVWVEIHGQPLNEPPNIGDGYRQLYAFPMSS